MVVCLNSLSSGCSSKSARTPSIVERAADASSPGAGHDAHEGGLVADDERRDPEDVMVGHRGLVRLAKGVAGSTVGHRWRAPCRRRPRRRRARRGSPTRHGGRGPGRDGRRTAPGGRRRSGRGSVSRTTRPASVARRSAALDGFVPYRVPAFLHVDLGQRERREFDVPSAPRPAGPRPGARGRCGRRDSGSRR